MSFVISTVLLKMKNLSRLQAVDHIHCNNGIISEKNARCTGTLLLQATNGKTVLWNSSTSDDIVCHWR